MGKPKMPHPYHEQHLCYLHNLGFVKSNLDDWKKLVGEPQFVCRKCGRAAALDKNLCKPDRL
jgi:uncharacterized membrane protein (UPF0182 family)